MRRIRDLIRRSTLGSIAVSPLFLCACKPSGILDPHGPVGASERLILIDSVAIMLAIVVPVIIVTAIFAWWFRASNDRAIYRPDWAYSGRLELLVWSIPIMVILFLGGITWVGSHDLDPRRPLNTQSQPLQIEVVSLDWKWLFIYPDQGIASINKLALPAGRPVAFRLSSATVMNSFFVPELGSQIYTMAGMETHLNLQADAPARFTGRSVQFSGDGFSDMHFDVAALPQSDFETWVNDARQNGQVLDRSAYDKLAMQKATMAPTMFKNVESGLFDHIVGGGMAKNDMRTKNEMPAKNDMPAQTSQPK